MMKNLQSNSVKNVKRCLFLHLTMTFISLVFAVTSTAAGELVLVKEGLSRAPVFVFENAPPRTLEAAEELAMFIEKVSGARPDVIEGEPDPVPDSAIWVGYQPVMDSLFPEQNFAFEHPEEILIAANENHLAITGRDRWDRDNLRIRHHPDHGSEIPFQFEYGTANAVYTFIQDYLDVRWFWPGELGRDIIKQDSIVFEPFEHRHHPPFRYRGGLLHSPMRGFRLGRGSYDWLRYQRLALGSLDVNAGGHGFGDWWNRFHEDHPEYFALQPDGKRSGFPSPGNVKMCHSNPAVAEQWVADVEAELKKNPTKQIFNASPNDSGASGHCICEDCRAWDHPDGEMLTFTWQGLGQQYVALSDRHVKFANRCARMLKERFPDRNLYVSMLAYGNWRPAPVEAVPDENVLIVNVANMFWGLDTEGRNNVPAQQFRDWGKVTDKQLWRPNTGDPAGWQKGLPDIPLHRNAEVIKFVADNGGIGISVDMVWEHWATQGPLYYLGTQLLWDPAREVDDIMDDYYQRAFGPASAELKDYWTRLEDARNRMVDNYSVQNEGYAAVYDQAFFDELYALMDRAAELTADGPDKFRDRVNFVRVGLDYTSMIAELRDLIQRVRESRGQDEEADRRAREIWDEIEQLCNDNPHTIRWRRITPGSRRIMRGGGLHPDHLR